VLFRSDSLKNGGNASPYMSITDTVKAEKRQQVPAVCHVDGTARLQTVAKGDNPLYYALILAFFKLTGIPMVLNTSFNRKSQPIVETPEQAVTTLMAAQGNIDVLFIGNSAVSLKPFPLKHTNKQDLYPDKDEGDYSMSATQFYLSEVLSSTTTGEPIRVRVQTGSAGDDDWMTLPSQLHFEILSLLQINAADNDDEGSARDVSVNELVDALQEIRGESEDNGPLLWMDVRDTLEWLYSMQLVYFDRNDDMIEADNVQDLFPSAKIVDLRDTLGNT